MLLHRHIFRLTLESELLLRMSWRCKLGHTPRTPWSKFPQGVISLSSLDRIIQETYNSVNTCHVPGPRLGSRVVTGKMLCLCSQGAFWGGAAGHGGKLTGKYRNWQCGKNKMKQSNRERKGHGWGVGFVLNGQGRPLWSYV